VRHEGKKHLKKFKKQERKSKGEEKRKEKGNFFEPMIQTSKIQTKAKTLENTTSTIL
jgi:hypothetical protein